MSLAENNFVLCSFHALKERGIEKSKAGCQPFKLIRIQFHKDFPPVLSRTSDGELE